MLFARRTSLLTLLWGVLAMCVRPVLGAEPGGFHITGIAVSERGGAPIAGCHIFALRSGQVVSGRGGRRRDQQEGDQLSTVADGSGRFDLTVPGAGNWQLYGYARGFRRQAFDRHEDFFSAVVLTAERPTYTVRFSLEPDSSVTGFVLDEAGEGVRNARVNLLSAKAETPELGEAGGSPRGSTSTDDRGHYEFAGLAPGDYLVEVQADPWYAAGSPGRRLVGNGGDAVTDPVLDVVYASTYFPGVPDRQAAEVLSLHHGESREADFHLTPSPATHLRIPPPAGVTEGTRGQFFPQVERISNEGNPFVNSSVQVDGRGQIDVGGLSPGLYRVTLRGPGGEQTPSFFRVTGGATRSIDFASGTPVAEVVLHFEGDEGDRMQVVFRDVETGATFVSFGEGGLVRRVRGAGGDAPGERRVEMPPGTYRVSLNGVSDLYLDGLAIKGGPVTSGRTISVGSGTVELTLKLARGRATVAGVTMSDGAPLLGAMVMLVPATFGQPGSIDVLRRDQTNTDGSFLINNVLPGNYILLAIKDGWGVNWHDPATLAGYLQHGVPLTLAAGAQVTQILVAEQP